MTTPTARRRALPALIVFAAGILTAWSGPLIQQATTPAMAEVSKSPPREAFKAGSERNEATLKEIAETLKTIDGRLERIEQLAAKGKPRP